MNKRDEIASQVRDLLAYFPGRGWPPLAWLIVLPLLGALPFSPFFNRMPNGAIPFALFLFAGRSVLWMYVATMLILLLRINHSDRSSWLESATIIASSALYGMIISLPSLLISLVLAASYVGVSFSSLLETFLGVFETIGAMFLLAAVLGAIAHYAGLLIALFLFLMKTAYVYLLPAGYSVTLVPEKWRMLEAAAPLAPAIVILRTGILNNQNHEMVSSLYWITATIHAALGFVLAFWICRGFSDHSDGPDQDTIGLQTTHP
jgi:ABC-type polysaccharide/polyol phosphate export permease